MRRTTICRSDVARRVALIGLLGCAGRVAAQQPAPAAAAQPSPGQTLAAPPASHIVQQGETLWSLARQFLGDPLLWAEIYRLNTDVVEDPHWIFPGEELRLVTPGQPAPVAVTSGADSTRGAPSEPPAVPAVESPTIFAARPARSQDSVAIEMRAEQAYRAVRAGEYYASGFIADRRTLPTGTLVGPTERSAISRIYTRSSAALYSKVVVTPPQGEGYRLGDILLVYAVDRFLPGYEDIIKPLGLLKVLTEANAGQSGIASVTYGWPWLEV